MDYIEILAEAWAGVDGKGDLFRAERDDQHHDNTGTYDGYMAEAKEIAHITGKRGLTIIPTAVLDDAIAFLESERDHHAKADRMQAAIIGGLLNKLREARERQGGCLGN